MSLTLPGMAAFLSACLALALGVLGLVVALPIAESRRARSKRTFWQSYAQVAAPPLVCAVVGLAWVLYLNDKVDDQLAPWPPITAVLAGVAVAFSTRRGAKRRR